MKMSQWEYIHVDGINDKVEFTIYGPNGINIILALVNHTYERLRDVLYARYGTDMYLYADNSLIDINSTILEHYNKHITIIYKENNDIIVDQHVRNWKFGISKLRYMRLNYTVNKIWKRYWYDQRDNRGYSRACWCSASKNCPNGYLIMTNY